MKRITWFNASIYFTLSLTFSNICSDNLIILLNHMIPKPEKREALNCTDLSCRKRKLNICWFRCWTVHEWIISVFIPHLGKNISSYFATKHAIWCESILCVMILLEHRLKVSGDRVLRSVFKPKRKEEMGLWRELQNEGLKILCYSLKIISIFKSWKVRWDT